MGAARGFLDQIRFRVQQVPIQLLVPLQVQVQVRFSDFGFQISVTGSRLGFQVSGFSFSFMCLVQVKVSGPASGFKFRMQAQVSVLGFKVRLSFSFRWCRFLAQV